MTLERERSYFDQIQLQPRLMVFIGASDLDDFCRKVMCCALIGWLADVPLSSSHNLTKRSQISERVTRFRALSAAISHRAIPDRERKLLFGAAHDCTV